ncbi:MAG: hypothetical protein QG625_970 [Cyanobacteriota bacterium erpe_2018_sw_39hr_WHONDRS-SW48-000098_B_bin.30]|jgi:hypothetical protein|nr:hypothetical protein [Cyanobacteriota bacterium erpe_2018_sw_39hr_WHONDRS-SW48-000098_B_bin.30]
MLMAVTSVIHGENPDLPGSRKERTFKQPAAKSNQMQPLARDLINSGLVYITSAA